MCRTRILANVHYFKFHVVLAVFILGVSACGQQDDNSDNTGSENSANTQPLANAGYSQNVITGTVVNLDASASNDVEGDELSYRWSFEAMPAGSTANLSAGNTIKPSFIADLDGLYILSLVVNDGLLVSVLSTVSIEATTASLASRTYAIVDSEQSTCYHSATGQQQSCTGIGYDADYLGNQPSYTLSDDGLTVSDNVTGLLWQQSSDINADGQVNYDDKLYQSEAVTYCANLSLAGRDDWRLPDIKEAYSLILFSGKDPSSYQGTDTSGLTLFLDDKFDRAFGDLDSGKDRIIDGQYASTSLSVATTMNGDPTMFGVNYVDGRVKGYPTHIKEYYVRCVSGNTDYGVNDFIDNGDTTISDKATGLMWQQDDSDSADWDDAVAQCEAANTASHRDWRLPNAKELQSIVDYSRSPDFTDSAAIDPLFNASSFINEKGIKDWGYYWSSTTHLNNSDDGSNAVYVAFGRALGYMQDKLLDVHGAGSQRSDDKLNVATEPGAQSASGSHGSFYYKGPQGDILRNNNKLRCLICFSVLSNKLTI